MASGWRINRRSILRWGGAGLLLLAALATRPGAARGDETFAPRLDGEVLVGAGVRSRWGFQVYAIGLYADPAGIRHLSRRDAADLAAAAFPKTVDIRMLRSVDAAKMREAFEEGLAPIRGTPEYDQFLGFFTSELTAGTRILIKFRSPVVSVSIGGQSHPPIHSQRLATALLNVWIGPKPINESLKEQLLSRLGAL